MYRNLLCLIMGLVSTGVLTAGPSAEAAKADNAFTFSLFSQVGEGEKNVVFSPLSIWTALAMTSAGAEGETLKQMREVLHLPLEDGAAHALAGGWAKELTALKKVELNVANRLWGAKELPFVEDFLKLTSAHYNACLETLDFSGDVEKARLTINAWVEKETRNRIKELLKPDSLDPATRLVLTNAVYFKGKWQNPFQGEGTRDRPFLLASGEQIEVKSMSTKMAVNYVETDRLQAVRLPYIGDQTSMIVVLPRSREALKGAVFLDADQFTALQNGLKPEPRVVVQMPRFEISASMSLPEALGKLGMKRAFTDKAEFSRMCQEPLKVSDVIHQAWVKVGEEGTEAAAATAVTMLRATAVAAPEPQPKLFIANHPFLFFIVDDRNGGILFAGRVMDPAK